MARFEPPRAPPPTRPAGPPPTRVPIWRAAPATTLLAGWTTLLFLLSWARPELTGAGSLLAERVWDGEWWRLVTSVFLHAGPIHFIFNAAWLTALGPPVEARYGAFGLVGVVLATGVAGGLGEMAATGLDLTSAVGLSGAIYGLFFFGFLALRPLGGPFARLFSRETFWLFAGWGVLAVVLTWADVARVANLAHGTGAAMGALLGAVVRTRGARRVPAVVGAAVLGAALVAAGFRPVWSPGYQLWEVRTLVTHGQARAALPLAERLAEDSGHPRAIAMWALTLRVLERDVEAEAVMARIPPPMREAVDRQVMAWYRLLAPFQDGDGVLPEDHPPVPADAGDGAAEETGS